MPLRHGLSTKLIRLKIIQGLTLAAFLIVGAAYLVVLSRPSVNPALAHTLTILLIALATYSLLLFSMTLGAVIVTAAALTGLIAWATTGSTLLGVDTVAFLILIGVTIGQQRRRQLRTLRLQQKLDDLTEELYLKEQALRITQQANESLQRKLHRYQQLQTIAEQLSRLVHLEGICQLAVDRAFELIGKSDVCLLFLVDKEHQELALSASKKSLKVSVIRSKQGDEFDRYVLRTQRQSTSSAKGIWPGSACSRVSS